MANETRIRNELLQRIDELGELYIERGAAERTYQAAVKTLGEKENLLVTSIGVLAKLLDQTAD